MTVAAPFIVIALVTFTAPAERAAPPTDPAAHAAAAVAPPGDDVGARIDDIDERARIAGRKVELPAFHGGALNWIWSRNLKLVTSLERTELRAGDPAHGDRGPEIVVFWRVHAAF